MLFLEMMKDEDHAPRVAKAAAASGLPVFLGFSTRIDRDTGKLVLYGTTEDAIPLTKEWFQNLADILGPHLVGVNVMHTKFNVVGPTLKFLREEVGWKGPLGAYPDHGSFKAPEWIFAELDTDEAMKYAQSWIDDYGVQLVGGCCGLGPDFITEISSLTRKHNERVRAPQEDRGSTRPA